MEFNKFIYMNRHSDLFCWKFIKLSIVTSCVRDLTLGCGYWCSKYLHRVDSNRWRRIHQHHSSREDNTLNSEYRSDTETDRTCYPSICTRSFVKNYLDCFVNIIYTNNRGFNRVLMVLMPLNHALQKSLTTFVIFDTDVRIFSDVRSP